MTEGPDDQRARVEQATAWLESRRTIDRSVRRLPALVRRSLELAWGASPRGLVVTFVLSVLTASGLAGMVVVSRSLFDEVLGAAASDNGIRGALGPLVAFVAVATFNQGVDALSLLQKTLLGFRVGIESEARALEATTRVPLERFEEPALHERIQQAVQLAGETPMQSVNALQTLVAGLLSVLAMGSVLSAFQPVLVPVLVAAASLTVWFSSRNALDRYQAMRDGVSVTLRRIVLQRLLVERDRAKEVRAFTLRSALLSRWRAASEEWMAINTRLIRRVTARGLVSTAATGLIGAVGWLSLLLLFLHHDLSLPETLAAGYAFRSARSWMTRVTGAVGALYESSLFFDAYHDFVEMGHALDAAEQARSVKVVEPFCELVVDHVSFTYPGSPRPALDDVSLSLAAGEVVALVGENGSGKTTLSKVLGQLYSATAGAVTWDGIDVSSIEPSAMRRHIAVIFQDFIRYELSGQENIGFGDVDRIDDLDAIRVAATDAGAHAYLETLGYDTVLSPRLGGVDLSGGQWQRIALARGFFRNAPFLVLDEPTSALDARAEKELFDRIRELTHGRTVLLVSHRFSTVRSADRILVMHEGRIVEEGSHAQLMALDGRYAELYTLQASAFLDPAP